MKSSIASSIATALILASAMAAFAQMSKEPAPQGADFTGVWYPSTGATLGAALPIIPASSLYGLTPKASH